MVYQKDQNLEYTYEPEFRSPEPKDLRSLQDNSLRGPSVSWRPSSTFPKDFFTDTTGPIWIKFRMQSSGKGGKNVYLFRPGHMTKMAAMPIYGKTIKSLLQNHWADCLETWYVVLGKLVL